jgi:hypothetical protein
VSPPEQFAEFVRGASPHLLHTAWLLTGDRHRAIVVFWRSPWTGSPKPTSDTAVSDLRAYDADGRLLPAGPHTQVSAG